MPTASFHTLGCKLNFSETGTLTSLLEKAGFQEVGFDTGADVYVINTCSVTEEADRKCRKVVRRALRANPDAFVAVVGCYAQLKPTEIANIPGVDIVLGAADKFRLPDYLADWQKKDETLVVHCNIEQANTFVPSAAVETRTRAFLKIQDGCDYKCSFCTIPLARGKSRSLEPKEVLAQAAHLVAAGAREIVISGINLGDYGARDPYKLPDVLALLDRELSTEVRLRLSSIEPNLLSDTIIDIVQASARFMPHFHVPLQSGNDKVLRAMRRRYARDLYADRVSAIKSRIPDAAIGVDVIVGFPGETEEDFADTQAFLAGLDITYLHVFPFSSRVNTPAAGFEDQILESVKKQRVNLLRSLSLRKQLAFHRSFIGQTRPVLFEETVKDGLQSGLTDNYIKVEVPAQPGLTNTILPVKLQQLSPRHSVVGDLVVNTLIEA